LQSRFSVHFVFLERPDLPGEIRRSEVAFPIILAWQLRRTDAATWGKLKKSADFIVSRSPSTPEERWEEAGGFSPSTIVEEIAGLVCAAD
jgi:glucoamylase